MTTYDLLLAAALLSAPPETPEVPPPADRWPALQAALHHTAVTWEILDPRETRYVLSRAEDFEADLNVLRKRFVDLADAPKLADSARFPSREVVNDLIRFNRAYRKHLDHRAVWEADRADAIRAVAGETDRLYKVWDTVRDAKCEFYYVTVRRQALKRLRDTLGDDAFEAGEMPAYVPDCREPAAK